MAITRVDEIFTEEVLQGLLPLHRSDDFFEALYGDPGEGAYDIRLAFKNFDRDRNLLAFDLELHQRPGKCLACNLTYGLPEVFSRHPLINIEGLVEKIAALLGEGVRCKDCELGTTQTRNDQLHVIPLLIRVTEAG